MTSSSLLVVALAPAVERYLWVSSLQPGGIMKATRAEAAPGGKGVHVALAAQALGANVVVTGILGGSTGHQLAHACAGAGLNHRWVAGTHETRWCTCLIDSEATVMTEVDEPATAVTGQDWGALVSTLGQIVAEVRPSAVALAGSLPGSVEQDDLKSLVDVPRASGVPILLDTSSSGLRAGLALGVDWVKVNESEAVEVVGGQHGDNPPRLARALMAQGAKNAIVTLGSRGAVAALNDGSVHAIAGRPVDGGYAVGSGDCFLAGLSVGLQEGDIDHALRLASAAARVNLHSPRVAQFTRADVDAEAATSREIR